MEKKKLIEQLEERNGELAKEILLNESAIYEAEKEITKIDMDLLDHSIIQTHINSLKLLIERIESKNAIYKKEIFENEIRLKNLSHDK